MSGNGVPKSIDSENSNIDVTGCDVSNDELEEESYVNNHVEFSSDIKDENCDIKVEVKDEIDS